MIFSLFRKDPAREAARALYEEIAAQARQPAFYAALGAPDTVDGRFDILCLHMALVLRRLRSEGAAAKDFSQFLFDAMVRNLDDNLREMGVGDLKVPKRMKALAETFYGRLAAYEAALEPAADAAALAGVVERNLYSGAAPEGAPAQFAGYARAVEAMLADQKTERLMLGVVRFPPAPTTRSEAAA